jgi:hypothetical protein
MQTENKKGRKPLFTETKQGPVTPVLCGNPSCPLQKEAQGSAAEPMKKCGKCRSVVYCSKECAEKHWKSGHKENCNWDLFSVLKLAVSVLVENIPSWFSADYSLPSPPLFGNKCRLFYMLEEYGKYEGLDWKAFKQRLMKNLTEEEFEQWMYTGKCDMNSALAVLLDRWQGPLFYNNNEGKDQVKKPPPLFCFFLMCFLLITGDMGQTWPYQTTS